MQIFFVCKLYQFTGVRIYVCIESILHKQILFCNIMRILCYLQTNNNYFHLEYFKNFVILKYTLLNVQHTNKKIRLR